MQRLAELIEDVPQSFGWTRTTWTRELPVRQLRRETGVKVGVTTLGRWLRGLRARWGRPKLYVACRWPRRQRARRMAEIARLLEQLPHGEVAL